MAAMVGWSWVLAGSRIVGSSAKTRPATGMCLQYRGARDGRRRAPLAKYHQPARIGAGPRTSANVEQRKWALITLSGQTFALSGKDIWCGIADVMGRTNANIEDAAGTSVSSLVLGSPDMTKVCNTTNSSFLVSAFHTHITPFSLPLVSSSLSEGGEGGANSIAVAVFVRASVLERTVPMMTNLLHTRFPQLVCTVTVGGMTCKEDTTKALASVQQQPWQRLLTGTIRLFGVDQQGQLAKISEVLQKCRVTILNLWMTKGSGDRETGEFVERSEGGLSETFISIGAFDPTSFDEAALRIEVEACAHDVGYMVTSITLDSQETSSQELALYLLQRKAFLTEFNQVESGLTSLKFNL